MAIGRVTFQTRTVNLATCAKGPAVCYDLLACPPVPVDTNCLDDWWPPPVLELCATASSELCPSWDGARITLSRPNLGATAFDTGSIFAPPFLSIGCEAGPGELTGRLLSFLANHDAQCISVPGDVTILSDRPFMATITKSFIPGVRSLPQNAPFGQCNLPGAEVVFLLTEGACP